jgi:hypothetical protein
MADAETVQPNAPAAPESSTPPPTPAASVPGAAGASTTTEAAQPESRRDTITRALADKKAEVGDTGLRDRLIAEGKIKPASPAKQAAAAQMLRDKGKFVAKAPDTPQAPVQQPAFAPEVPQAVPLPKWLKKELEGEWTKAPLPLQQAFAKYGDDATKGIDKWRSEAEKASAFMRELQPFEQMVRSEGGTIQTAVKSMLQIASQLRTGSPQDKASLVAQTMRQYGVPFEHIAHAFGVRLTDANGQPVQPSFQQQDPQVAALMREMQSIKGSIQSRQQAEQAELDARAAKAAESLARELPHFEELKPQIAKVIQGGLVEGMDSMSEAEIYKAAHGIALRLNPDLYEQNLAQERERAAQAERDKANQVAQASRAAAVQVRGAPGSKSLPDVTPGDRRSAIRHAIALHTRT